MVLQVIFQAERQLMEEQGLNFTNTKKKQYFPV